MAGEFCAVAGTPAASKGWGCVMYSSDGNMKAYGFISMKNIRLVLGFLGKKP